MYVCMYVYMYVLCMYVRTYIHMYVCMKTASVVYWSEFLATDTEVPGSIPQSTVSSGRVRSICSERAVREECCFVYTFVYIPR